MQVNASKCLVISFSNSRQTLQFEYQLHDVMVIRVDQVRGIGILLVSNLKLWSPHRLSNVCGKSLKTLELITRTCRQGLSASSFRTLYVALARPIMESSVTSSSETLFVHGRGAEATGA